MSMLLCTWNDRASRMNTLLTFKVFVLLVRVPVWEPGRYWAAQLMWSPSQSQLMLVNVTALMHVYAWDRMYLIHSNTSQWCCIYTYHQVQFLFTHRRKRRQKKKTTATRNSHSYWNDSIVSVTRFVLLHSRGEIQNYSIALKSIRCSFNAILCGRAVFWTLNAKRAHYFKSDLKRSMFLVFTCQTSE